jgi:hypothetical protein
MMALTGTAVVAVVAFFILVPVVNDHVKDYGSLNIQPVPTISNWESASCALFGFGALYGTTPFMSNASYRLGCLPPFYTYYAILESRRKSY